MGEGNAIISIIDDNGFVGAELAQALVSGGSASQVKLYTSATVHVPIERVQVCVTDLAKLSDYAAELSASTHVYQVDLFSPPMVSAAQKAAAVTQSIIRHVTGGALKHYVYVSSSGSNPISESALKQTGFPLSIFHTGLVYGRNLPARSYLSSWMRLVQARSRWLHVALDIPVPLIHVEDLAQALVRVITTQPSAREYDASTELTTVGTILGTLYEHSVGHRPRQFPSLGTKWFFQRQFPFIPTPSDRAADFRTTFFPAQSVQIFYDRAIDCISTHIDVRGYWVVTGANSGIGYELVCRLHAAGKHLIMADKDVSNLSGFGHQRIIKVDLASSDEVSALAEKISSYEIIALVNNAGVGFKGNFADQLPDAVATTLHVNVFAPVQLTQAMLPQLIRHDGVLVNIASSAAFNPLPGMALYAASKSFVLQWSTALWYELRGACRVITFSPSGTNTNFQKSAGVRNTTKLFTPDAVARRVYEAIRTGQSFVFIGFKNRVIAYITKLFPAGLSASFWGKLFHSMR